MDNDLDAALNELGLLSSVTNARKEYLSELNELKVRNSRSLPSLANIAARKLENNPNITKENLDNLEKCLNNGCPLRMNRSIATTRRSRVVPYEIRRRPLSNVCSPERHRKHFWRSSSSCSAASSCSFSSSNSFHTERDRDRISIEFNCEEDHLEPLSLFTGLKKKTDKRKNYTLLPRSKSLEDLRGVQDKHKVLIQNISIEDAIMPRQQQQRRNNFILRKGSGDLSNIKTEIDSVSLRIESLNFS